MNLFRVVVSTWATKDWEKNPEVVALAKKLESKSNIDLDKLITFSGKNSTPSLSLPQDLQDKLFDLLKGRSKQPAQAALAGRLARPLSLFPHYQWAGRIVFEELTEGIVTVRYCSNKDYAAEITSMRNQFIQS